jgi:hypothetical protein
MKCHWKRKTIFLEAWEGFNLGTIFQMKNHSIDGSVEKVQEKFNWFKSSIPLHRGKLIFGKYQ